MKVNSFKNLVILLFLVFITEVCYGEKPYLGVTFSITENNKLPITAVYYNTPAYKYDLRKGDIILKYNDIKVTDHKTYTAYINGMKSGDTLKLEILRNNNQLTKTIKLENMPNMKPFANVSWKMPGGGNYGVDEEVFLWSSYIENGNTPLMKACQGNNYPIVKKMLKAGAKVNEKNKNGKTPISITAKKHGLSLIIPILVKASADLNERNEFGENIITLALHSERHFWAVYTDTRIHDNFFSLFYYRIENYY